MWLEMKVKQLALDPLSNMPMIVLRDEEEKRSLPIWVGLAEANAKLLREVFTDENGGRLIVRLVRQRVEAALAHGVFDGRD